MSGLLINVIFLSVGAKFLLLGIGAREIAMGSIGSVLVRDANATYFNPALLSFVNKGNLSAMHSNYLLDMRMESVSLSHPFGKIFTGVNFYGFFVSELEGRSGPSETFIPFGASFLNTNLSLSAFLFKNLSIGLTLKNIYEKIDTFSSSSFAFDMGFVYKPEKSYFEIGGVISNIGGKLKLKSENFELPSSFKIGAGFYYRNIKFAVEVFKIFKENTEFKIGGEYTIREILSLRAGYVTGYSQTSSLAGFATGFGIRYHDFNFDYAFQPYGELGNVHRVSVGFAFAPLKIKFPGRGRKAEEPEVKKEKIIKKEIIEKPVINIDSLYNLALKEFENKNILSSFELFFKVIYIRDDYKKTSEYFNLLRDDLINKKLELILGEYKRNLDKNNFLDAYAVLKRAYEKLDGPDVIKQKIKEVRSIIIKRAKLNKTEIETLDRALSFYTEKRYKKALRKLKRLKQTELIKRFVSLCEEKRDKTMRALKRDLDFYVRNGYFEKGYDIVKKLEEEGYYSTEFMVVKTRIEKKLEEKAKGYLEQAEVYKKNGNYIEALLFVAKSIDIYPSEDAEKLEKEILDIVKNKKEIYEGLMEKAIIYFNQGRTDDAFLLWKEAEKLNSDDKRFEYVKIYRMF